MLAIELSMNKVD